MVSEAEITGTNLASIYNKKVLSLLQPLGSIGFPILNSVSVLRGYT